MHCLQSHAESADIDMDARQQRLLAMHQARLRWLLEDYLPRPGTDPAHDAGAVNQGFKTPMPRLFCSVVAVMLLWFDVAGAAELSGKVMDEGEPLPMVEVLLINADSSVLLGSLFSATDGGFHFRVPVGRYHLSASRKGYADGWVRDIDVSKADVVQDIELLPEAFAESEAVSTDSDGCD